MKTWTAAKGVAGIFIFLLALLSSPALATTPLPATEPYITIDPIGNHTAGDVFFVNGTTNLGRWENTLGLDIEWWAFNPAGRWSPLYVGNVSIRPVGDGTGTWSAEIQPSRWVMYTDVEHRTTVFRAADPGEYVAYMSSTSPLGPSVISQQTFFLFPHESNRTPELPDVPAAANTDGTGSAPVPTPHTPLPAAVPLAGIAVLVIARSLCGRNR